MGTLPLRARWATRCGASYGHGIRRPVAAMTARERLGDAVSEDWTAPDRIRTCGLKLRNPVPWCRTLRTARRDALSERLRKRSGPSEATLMATDPRYARSEKDLEIR